MDERGQSAIELVVAAAVVAVLCAVIVPRTLWNGGALALDHEAARLAAELQYFRTVMMSTQRVHSDFPSVSAEATPRFFMEADKYYIMSGTKRDRVHELPSGIVLSSPSREAVFGANGNGNTLTVVMRTESEIRYVIIDLAGRVRVSRDPPKS